MSLSDLSNIIPIPKSGPIKPLIYKHLITSTPDSHQISKRIKGLLGYSEHYKGDRLNYPIFNPSFPPLRAKDYRKARDLTLEIWDPMIQIGFLERFLKSQKNLQTIRIKIITKKDHRGEILKRLCGILGKMGGLNRVHIDFDKEQMRQALPGCTKRVRSMRMLPKLKDLDITLDGEQVIPFSVSLAKVGFDGEKGLLTVKDLPVIQKLIPRALKLNHLDTIRINSMNFFAFPDKFLDALVLVISKLPSLRELDFNYSKDFYLPLKQTFNILDTLGKAPKFETLRLGLQMKGISQISLLKHPLFKAKSLKRLSLSLFFYREVTPKDLNQIFDLLGAMPSLYEISIDFSNYTTMSDEIAEAFMKKISEITSLRKLKIRLTDSAVELGARQAGNMIHSIFNMPFLEELDLQLPKNCLELGGGEIQGLPRLRKASLNMVKWGPEREDEIRGLVEILGKCPQLRELELSLHDSVHNYQAMTVVLCESLRRLKGLEVFELDASAYFRSPNMTIDSMEELVRAWNKLRRLQDLSVRIGLNPNESSQRFHDMYQELLMNRKYRRFALGF